jgi:hypothetical protein
MKRNHLTHCAVMFAAGVALLLAFGVQASSLLYLGVLLACPLMMFFMMRGMMGGGHDAGCNHDHTDGNAGRDHTERTP